MKLRSTIICLLASVLFLFTVVPAQALRYSFYNITTNDTDDVAIGVAQLWVDVTDPNSNQVLFTFGNTGSQASSICDVYFDNGIVSSTLSTIDAIYNTANDPSNSLDGVLFSRDATPPNLPGGNQASPAFVVTAGADFSADSDPKVQPNGVNPGEKLGILFNLKSGLAFSNVLADLESHDLRIGIHVQGFDGGGSESFINGDPIPEPATMLLLGSGLIGIAVSGKKRFKKRNR